MKLFYFRVLQGGTPENYYCLDFEIAVDQQHGPVAELLRVFRTFEGVLENIRNIGTGIKNIIYHSLVESHDIRNCY